MSASSLLRSVEPRMSCTYDQCCEFGSGTFPWIQNYLFQIRIAAKNSKFNSFKLVDLLFDWFYGKFFNIKKIEVGTGTFPGSLINHSGLTALFIRQYYDVKSKSFCQVSRIPLLVSAEVTAASRYNISTSTSPRNRDIPVSEKSSACKSVFLKHDFPY